PIPWNKSPNRCFLGTTQIGGNALFLAKTFGNQALCPTTSAKAVEERFDLADEDGVGVLEGE
ncbi:MAG: hypothetical protein ABSD29_09125, partial [Verrucomicrobiota bacterium]